MIVLIDIIERVLRIKWHVIKQKVLKLFFLFLLSHSKDCPNCRAKAQLKSAVPVKVSESFTP